MTLGERIKSNCLISEESGCPNLELLRKGLGYGYERGTLFELHSEREPASHSTRPRAETVGSGK